MSNRNIEVKIICDSINPAEIRLTTFILTYPRFIHSEFMTHRAFSRNAASSRAIPIKKMIDAVGYNTAHPEFWGVNKPGMQADEQSNNAFPASTAWRTMALIGCDHAEEMEKLGIHKQISNRLLEPFSHITVVTTADQYGLANFFALRAHPDAQPEFQVLAYRMLHAYLNNEPDKLQWGEWHLPFYDGKDIGLCPEERLKVCTARCARVSYLNHEGEYSMKDDLKLYERLLTSKPPHASAFEHCAKAINGMIALPGEHEKRKSNFDFTWLQYRKTIAGETTTSIDLKETLNNKPGWISL